jgi:hypothetical protein
MVVDELDGLRREIRARGSPVALNAVTHRVGACTAGRDGGDERQDDGGGNGAGGRAPVRVCPCQSPAAHACTGRVGRRGRLLNPRNEVRCSRRYAASVSVAGPRLGELLLGTCDRRVGAVRLSPCSPRGPLGLLGGPA